MLVTGLAFGGGYATLLALPFLFAAFSLVAAYLSNPSHDKGFVRIGLALAGGFFFAPLSSLLFIAVVSLGLLVFNLGHRRFAHGFYQFLAVALGFHLSFIQLPTIVLQQEVLGMRLVVFVILLTVFALILLLKF